MIKIIFSTCCFLFLFSCSKYPPPGSTFYSKKYNMGDELFEIPLSHTQYIPKEEYSKEGEYFVYINMGRVNLIHRMDC
jgi:hypothetical protein